jgi:hypothetical protein
MMGTQQCKSGVSPGVLCCPNPASRTIRQHTTVLLYADGAATGAMYMGGTVRQWRSEQ